MTVIECKIVLAFFLHQRKLTVCVIIIDKWILLVSVGHCIKRKVYCW